MEETFDQKLRTFDNTKEFYFGLGINKLSEVELDGVDEILKKYLGKRVSVSCMSGYFTDELKEFENTIRITSILEYSEDRKQYRLLVDDSNYCYFERTNVVEFGTYGNEKDFSTGAKAVIGIKF